MKIIFSLLIFFFIVVSLNAQDFSFNLMFVDSQGNKDSLLLGYRIDAHDDLFVSDGEINIAGTPRDSNLCARISDSFQDGFVQPGFESKVSISLDHCEDFWFYPVTIDINSKNWPITASWDSEKFETECVIGTVFTDFPPGGWFDAGGCCSDLEYVYLSDTNEVTFTQAFYPNNNGGSGYINESGDTISTFFFAFGDSGLLNLMAHPIKKEKQFEIFPNPAFDYIEIISDYQDLSNPEIFIYSSYGKLFKKVVQNGKVDISDLASGLYFVGINGDAFHEFKALIIFR